MPGKRKRSSSYRTYDKYAHDPSGRYTDKRVRKMAQPEVKIHDSTHTYIGTPTTGWQIAAWNQLSQGVQANQRVGRKIFMNSFEMRGRHDAASSADRYRVLIILDRQSNGALVTQSELFSNNTMNAMINANNLSRFKVLADYHPWIAGQTSYSANEAKMDVHLYRKIKDNATYVVSGSLDPLHNELIVAVFLEGVNEALIVDGRLKYTDY